MAGIGQERPYTRAIPKVRFLIRMRTFEPIAAPHNDLLVGYVGSRTSERKQLVGMDLVALGPEGGLRL